MNRKQKIAIIGIVAVTLVLAMLVLVTSGKPAAESGSGEGSAHGSESHERHDEAAGKPHEGEAGDKSGDEEKHADEADAVHLSQAQIDSAGITIETAGPARIVTTLTLPGEIRFNQDRTSHIVPRIDGIAESVHAELGAQVKRGQVLAVLASTTISELRSEAMAAQERLRLAKTIYAREKKLWEDKISAEQDYLQAQQALQEAEIAARNARQKLLALGASVEGRGGLNRFELRAPFDGMIVERHLSLGEAVRADTKVMTLSDLSTVWAEIIVSARDLNTVKVGTPVVVRATSLDSQAKGKISYVGSLLGEQTRTATARVTLPNPDQAWRPGLFVNVEIASGEVEAPVTVAAEAIHTLEKRSVVFVRTDEGFKAVPVEIGRSDGNKVEIVRGLAAGERYAARGSFVIKSELGKDAAGHDH